MMSKIVSQSISQVPELNAQGAPSFSSDPAIAKLHHLADLSEVDTFDFLKDFKNSTRSDITSFYGDIDQDRLAKLQYKIDSNLIMDPGTHQNLPTKESTWGANVEFGEHDRKLNEDAILKIQFGNKILAAVFDGASSQRPIDGLIKFGVTGAWYISHLASLQWPETSDFKILSSDPNVSAKNVMIALNSWLKSKLSKIEGVDYNNVLYIPGMAATIALIDIKNSKVQIAHVADTMAIAEYDDNYAVLTNNDNAPWDQETEDIVDKIVEDKKAQGIDVNFMEASRDQSVKDWVAKSFMMKINTPETPEHRKGTGILNGMYELISNNLIYETEIDIPKDKGMTLHLLSDGLYSAWMGRIDLDQDDMYRRLLGALNTPGYYPGSAMHEAFVRLKLDPNAQVIRRIIKAHDDASRLSITLRAGDEHSEFRAENLRRLHKDFTEIVQLLTKN